MADEDAETRRYALHLGFDGTHANQLKSGQIMSRLIVCADFLPTCRDENCCHICRQPKGAHPDDDDAEYWRQWLISEIMIELHDAPKEDAET